MAFNVRNYSSIKHENIQNGSSCSTNKKVPRPVRQWCEVIEIYSNNVEIDPLLVAAVIEQESGGRENAISKDGAVGLMQIMPGDGKALEFQCQGGACFLDRPSTESLLKPEYNISYGVEMLSGLIQITGDFREALFLYGPFDVGYDYADKVINIWEGYK